MTEAPLQKCEAPGRWRGAGAEVSSPNSRNSNGIRLMNTVADARAIRLDLLRSLRLKLPAHARERLLGEVRELVRAGEISRVTARELRTLFGGADYV